MAEYLLGRGITLSLPPALRFHPNLKHDPSGERFPALVAAVTDLNGNIQAIQRTFLAHDGQSKAPVEPAKMSLGPVSGGHVALAEPVERIWLTEGVEDALSVMQMFDEPAWALLGVQNFKTVEVPDGIRTVVLAPDNDNAGTEILSAAADRFHALGLEVRVARPPEGQDWCDLLGEYEERAAIREFEGEESRDLAERLTRQEILRARGYGGH